MQPAVVSFCFTTFPGSHRSARSSLLESFGIRLELRIHHRSRYHRSVLRVSGRRLLLLPISGRCRWLCWRSRGRGLPRRQNTHAQARLAIAGHHRKYCDDFGGPVSGIVAERSFRVRRFVLLSGNPRSSLLNQTINFLFLYCPFCRSARPPSLS